MKLVWTKTAELILDAITDYIKVKFGNLSAEKYYLDVLETVENIKMSPELFPIYQQNEKIRKAVINKKTILYYNIQEDNINLLAFYDVRKGIHNL